MDVNVCFLSGYWLKSGNNTSFLTQAVLISDKIRAVSVDVFSYFCRKLIQKNGNGLTYYRINILT